MKQVLKDLLDSKQKLFDMQEFFTKTLEKSYPTLTKVNSDELKRQVNKEIEFLLSSTVRIKSGRVVIKALNFEWTKEIVLTRNPGLKRPYDRDSVFSLTNIILVEKNGDIVRMDRYNSNRRGIIKTSMLKESDLILQDKLKDFYVHLKKIVEWTKILNSFISPSYGDENIKIILENKSRIKICDDHFSFLIYDPESKERNNSDRLDEINSTRLTDYTRHDYGENPRVAGQEPLLKLWKDYDLFDKALMSAEKKKKDLIRIGKNILKELIVYNKPVRLFNKLMEK